MANYYMIITTREDYTKDVENAFACAGFPKRNRRSVKKMEIDDRIIYYVSKVSKFCAAVKVIGEPYVEFKQIWNDPIDLWPYRIKTEPIVFKKTYPNGVYIKDIWDNLDFISNKNKWGSQVMGSFRHISEHDYHIIEEALLNTEEE